MNSPIRINSLVGGVVNANAREHTPPITKDTSMLSSSPTIGLPSGGHKTKAVDKDAIYAMPDGSLVRTSARKGGFVRIQPLHAEDWYPGFWTSYRIFSQNAASLQRQHACKIGACRCSFA